MSPRILDSHNFFVHFLLLHFLIEHIGSSTSVLNIIEHDEDITSHLRFLYLFKQLNQYSPKRVIYDGSWLRIHGAGINSMCAWGSPRFWNSTICFLNKSFFSSMDFTLDVMSALSFAVNPTRTPQLVSQYGEPVVLCTHYPPYKTNDPDLWNCKAGNGCIELQRYYLDCVCKSRGRISQLSSLAGT